MGKRGPAPKPTPLKIIEGNRGRRPLPVDEFMPLVALPECPAHLDGAAREEWNRIVPVLEKYGNLLTEVDGPSLALYCQAYARWQEAEELLNEFRARSKDGRWMLTRTPSGYTMQNPAIGLARSAAEEVNRYLQQFGLSPASRTRVQVPQGRTENDAKPKTQGADRFFA